MISRKQKLNGCQKKMLNLDCLHGGVTADETELSPASEAHLKRFGPGSTAEAFTLSRFKEGRFIDESVAAGVAH